MTPTFTRYGDHSRKCRELTTGHAPYYKTAQKLIKEHLTMNFKNNDKVTCKIKGVQIDNAMISIDEGGDTYICHNEPKCCGAKANDLKGYNYSWHIRNYSNINDVTDLKLATEVHPKVGDVYIDTTVDKEVTVLEVTEHLIALSDHIKNDVYCTHVTRAELARDYTIKEEKWRPMMGKQYRCIMPGIKSIHEYTWLNDGTDRARLAIGNVFPPEGNEAEEARKRVIKALKNE